MSTPVDVAALSEVVEGYGGVAVVVTVADDRRPHTVSAAVRLEGGVLVADVGRTSAGNAIAHPDVTVLWHTSAARPGYGLIVDGTAEVRAEATQVPGASLRIHPTRAVEHRHVGGVDATGPTCIPVGEVAAS